MVKQLEAKYRNAKVYFRILPMAKMCWEHVKILDDRKTIFLRCLQDFEVGREMCKPSYWHFETDGVFYNNTQREVYEAIVPGILESALDGNNAIILAYGQTGSGKSLTMSGVENLYEDRGIIPRIIADLFGVKRTLQGKLKVCYQMSYIETTKVYIYDLLKDDDNVFDMNSMKNISAISMQNEEQALKTIFLAEGRKSNVKGSPHNSHTGNAVFSITIITKSLNRSAPTKTVSKIHIVDLAGVDTIGNLSCFYKNWFDIGTANLAKSQLEQFLLILIENIPERILINHRLSILVHYLRDSLNAQSLLRFIGHIRTNKDDLRITISMLRFGQIVRGLKPKKTKPDILENEDLKVQILEDEVNRLKRERDLNGMLVAHELATNVTQDRLLHMQNVAEEYLQNKTNELVVVNVTDVETVLKVFKDMYKKLETEKNECMDAAYRTAYEDAMQGSLKRDSTLSSRSSRKSSNKAKESLTVSGQPSKSSRRSLKQSPSRLSEKKEKSRTGGTATGSRDAFGGKPLGQTRTSSKLLKKSSSSKKKASVTSVDKNPEEANKVPVPDKVPDYDEAWRLFTDDGGYEYKCMMAEMEAHEAKAKEGNTNYLREVKRLQEIRDALGKINDDLLKAQMQSDIGETVYDENGNVILSRLEMTLTKAKREVTKNLTVQQEKVLGLQAELRLLLQLYQDTKRSINDKFEQFCCDKYRTLVPNLQSPVSAVDIIVPSPTPEESLDERAQGQKKEEETKLAERYNKLMKYESLKKLMHKQKEKRLQKQILTKKWVQSCKN